MISTYWNGEVLQVMERGKQIGYVEGSTLYMFDKDGYAEKYCNITDRSEIPQWVKRYKFDNQVMPIHAGSEADRLIGTLLAHLVIHEPDAQCVKAAREYLSQRR
jgi:hypothetical protein